MLTGLQDGTVVLWEINSGRKVLEIASPDRGGPPKPVGFRDRAFLVALREEGTRILVASFNHGFRTYDGESGKLLKQHRDTSDPLMTVSQDGTLAVINEDDGPTVRTHPEGVFVARVRTRGAVRRRHCLPMGSG